MTPRDSLALNEKNRADRILDRLDELFKLNHSPDTQGWQTYGVLMSLAMLGPHSSGMVHFIEPYAHPEVVRQQEVLSSLRRAHRTRDEYREVRKSIKSTRNHVYKLVDFGRLCQEALYVPTAPSPFPNHIQASIDDIMQQSLALFDTHGDDTWKYLDMMRAFHTAQHS